MALSSDPVTIESALADVGLGSVLNVGFGLLGRGAERGGNRMAAKIAGEDAAVAAREVVEQVLHVPCRAGRRSCRNRSPGR